MGLIIVQITTIIKRPQS